MVSDTSRLRLAIVGVIGLSLFAAVFTRLLYLQVMDARELQALATQNQVREVFEPAPRGRILDRQGRPIVTNKVSQMVTVKRLEVEGDPEVLSRLAPLLGISRAELTRRIEDTRYSRFRPVPVAEDVSEELLVYLREHAQDFKGVEVVPSYQRAYPNGALAAHVLGYVGEINDKELAARKDKGYRLGDEVGKSGVEQTYEEDLRGRPGRVQLEVDALGRVVRTLSSTPSAPGNDVQLTVDLDVQRLAEESLERGLAAARGRNRGGGPPLASKGGAAVVLDPRDGSVLAMASNPTYDPGAFVNGIRPELFESLQAPPSGFPLNNRAIQGEYAPGSTFKLFTAVAALQTGMITPGTTILDTGEYRLPSCRGQTCTFRNAGSVSYGRVNLTRALTVSSDVYFYGLGADFWFRGGANAQAIQSTARQLGFGDRTGIPLSGEQKGRILDAGIRKKLNESNPEAFPNGRWYAGDNVNLSIGQGETVVTPLQLANAYATFANGGTLFSPRVAVRVLKPSGEVIRQLPPSPLRQVELPPNLRDPILEGLSGAVADPDGTAHGAFAGFPLDVFPVAGKTGTAQVMGKNDTAVFAAFAPARAPRYALSVFMEESGFGGAVAAPVARRVFEGLAGKPVGPVRLVGAVD
ncbi:MAG: penicillin-binding protein 2 [Actinomycetota bacterium]|nr:penicillin-binding protein 2 [Actinomycetota bacterium]MDQ3679825.1 penicillin-binding protein 2 [Actinomycetota bacterium]